MGFFIITPDNTLSGADYGDFAKKNFFDKNLQTDQCGLWFDEKNSKCS